MICLCSTVSGASVRKTPVVKGWNFLEASSCKCLAPWLEWFKAQLGAVDWSIYKGLSMYLGFCATWWPRNHQASLRGESHLQEQVFQWTQWNLHGLLWFRLGRHRFRGTLVWSGPRACSGSKWRRHRSWLLMEGMSKNMQPCFKMTRDRWEDKDALGEPEKCNILRSIEEMIFDPGWALQIKIRQKAWAINTSINENLSVKTTPSLWNPGCNDDINGSLSPLNVMGKNQAFWLGQTSLWLQGNIIVWRQHSQIAWKNPFLFTGKVSFNIENVRIHEINHIRGINTFMFSLRMIRVRMMFWWCLKESDKVFGRQALQLWFKTHNWGIDFDLWFLIDGSFPSNLCSNFSFSGSPEHSV